MKASETLDVLAHHMNGTSSPPARVPNADDSGGRLLPPEPGVVETAPVISAVGMCDGRTRARGMWIEAILG